MSFDRCVPAPIGMKGSEQSTILQILANCAASAAEQENPSISGGAGVE